MLNIMQIFVVISDNFQVVQIYKWKLCYKFPY